MATRSARNARSNTRRAESLPQQRIIVTASLSDSLAALAIDAHGVAANAMSASCLIVAKALRAFASSDDPARIVFRLMVECSPSVVSEEMAELRAVIAMG